MHIHYQTKYLVYDTRNTSTEFSRVLGLLLRWAVERDHNRVVTLVGFEGNLLLGLVVLRLQLRNLSGKWIKEAAAHASARNDSTVSTPLPLHFTAVPTQKNVFQR